MSELENPMTPTMKGKDAMVSILDESLFIGDQKQYKLLCTIDHEFISIAAVDLDKNKYSGFEGFHFSKSLNDEQLVRKISELTQQSTILKKIDFRNVSVQIANSRFTFIPSALFKAEDAEQYFYFNHPKREAEAVHFDIIRSYDAVNIFSVSRQLIAELKNAFENFSVHHQLTSLLEASRFYTRNKPERNMFIHVHSSCIDLIVLEEKKLIFANSFFFKGTEDGIYFVMMTCDQLSMNPERVEVLLSGEVEKEGAFIKQLHKYISHISFCERNKAALFTYGFDEIPAHFYHAAFSHILCEL